MGIFGFLETFLPSEHAVEKMGFVLELVIIMVAIKLVGELSKRIGQPSVFGKLLVGIILGPSVLGIIHPSEILTELAEVGVILLMFLAGLETDVEEFTKSAGGAAVAAVLGVIAPLAAGYVLGIVYGYDWAIAIFIGTILVATSVSISVQTLRELGKLQTREGFTILGAAVIDDILGLVTLSIVLGITVGGGGGTAGIAALLIKVVVFFLLAALVGIKVLPAVMKWASKFTVTVPVLTFAIVIALGYAVVAEYMGMAAIVGAYMAGLMLSMTPFQHQLFEQVEHLGYSLLIPIFFVSIGIAADISQLSGGMIVFTVIATVLAVLTKLIGCGAGALISGFDMKGALGVGAGMVARGEVALIVANIGLVSGLIGTELYTSMVVVAIVTTIAAPPMLRIVFSDKKVKSTA